MSFDLQSLIPEHIRNLRPYSSARDEFQEEERAYCFLDANELPASLEGLPLGINRYPGAEPARLKEKLAAIKEVNAGNVFLGNGSDEIIDLIMRCFSQPGKSQVMVFPPTFGMYAVRARVNNLGVCEVPLNKDFKLDASAALDASSPNTTMAFVCHPNNPTGNCQPRDQIIKLLESFEGIVVADEAYIDFSSKKSLLPLLGSFPNLIILQTFSKAYGLAGARIGTAYASEEIVQLMDRIKLPYNMGKTAICLAEKALNSQAFLRMNVASIAHKRDQMAKTILGLPLTEAVYPSDANFLLVKTRNAHALYQHLIRQGVVVRNRDSEPGCRNCLRITVGTTSENQRLIAAWSCYGETGLPSESLRNPLKLTGDKQSAIAEQPHREAAVRRQTKETDIMVRINLDGEGYDHINTGIPFFDHMLQQIARHGMVDLEVDAKGDLEVDAHHTIEDVAITMGEALEKALGNKRGIERYGFSLPMDDSSAEVLMDLGGRAYLRWKVALNSSEVGGVPSSLFRHFFRSFAESAHCNVHIIASGEDDHHTTEAIFKAFARTLRQAVSQNQTNALPSTKGKL